MEAIYLKPKDLSPGISLDKDSDKFQLYGISCPPNAFEFYEPVFKWFEEYKKDPLELTVFDLNFSYFNTSSAKFLLIFMNKLGELTEHGFEVKIRWLYSEDDEDMREEGEEFEDLVDYDIDFEYIPVNSDNFETDDDFESILNDTF
ncbi:MAG: DUF1987 domain-containing protein [Bacteroidales bacterium]|nr:DUF1987 domain-containing protein [Bacteroidales bacterium]